MALLPSEDKQRSSHRTDKWLHEVRAQQWRPREVRLSSVAWTLQLLLALQGGA